MDHLGMKATEICAKASELVGGDRQAAHHGDKSINLQNIADIWNAILVAKRRFKRGRAGAQP